MGYNDRPRDSPALKATAVLLPPDGTRIVTTAYGDNTAWLWDGKTGHSTAVLKEHEGVVKSAIFFPDGSTTPHHRQRRQHRMALGRKDRSRDYCTHGRAPGESLYLLPDGLE